MKVAVIGLGAVGRAQVRMLAGHEVVPYDVADGPYPAEAVAGCDFAVICVGTPGHPDGAADLSQLQAAFASLPGTLPALIRSTVPPGVTDAFALARPGVTAFCPEFIYEGGTGPWTESAAVPWLLLGGTAEAREFFWPRLARVYGGKIHECPAAVAELAKYTANLHWAMRVIFVNEMAAIAAAHGLEWEDVRAAWLADERVNPAHTAMAGFPPGFAGRCWPKDLSAIITAAREAGYGPGFLEAIEAANDRFRGGAA